MLPQYTTKPDLKRLIVGHSFISLLLLVIFGGVLLLNLFLLKVELDLLVYVIVFVVMLILFCLDLILFYTKSQYLDYNFYLDKIEAGKKSLQLANVESISTKINIFDKLFGTGTLVLKPKLKLYALTNAKQVED